MHDRNYRQARAAALVQPLLPEERLYLATVSIRQPLESAWSDEVRRLRLVIAEVKLLDEIVRDIADFRQRRLGLTERQRASVQQVQYARLAAGIRRSHRIVWSPVHFVDGEGHHQGEVLSGRFVPRDEPAEPRAETPG